MEKLHKFDLFEVFELGECYRVNSAYKAPKLTVEPEQYYQHLRLYESRDYSLETDPILVGKGELLVVLKQEKLSRGFSTASSIVFIWFINRDFKSMIWEGSPCHMSFSYYYSKVS
jgi:hypothetical protein